jgi:RNA polymerase sigma factor (sigma-70 family)
MAICAIQKSDSDEQAPGPRSLPDTSWSDAMRRQAWNRLLRFLAASNRKQSAGAAYETTRQRLVRFFNRWEPANSQDLADETLDRLAQILGHASTSEIRNPSAYIIGIARRVWVERVKVETARRNKLRKLMATSEVQAEPTPPSHEHLEALRRCLGELSPGDRELLILYYYDNSPQTRIATRRALSKAFGLSAGSLRVRIHRLRLQLECRLAEVLSAA